MTVQDCGCAYNIHRIYGLWFARREAGLEGIESDKEWSPKIRRGTNSTENDSRARSDYDQNKITGRPSTEWLLLAESAGGERYSVGILLVILSTQFTAEVHDESVNLNQPQLLNAPNFGEPLLTSLNCKWTPRTCRPICTCQKVRKLSANCENKKIKNSSSICTLSKSRFSLLY